MSNGEAAERAYVAAMVANADAQLADVTASTRADLDRLAESWREGYGQQLAGHEDRIQAMRDETRAWLRSIYDDEAAEPASTQNVGQGQADAFLGSSPASPPGPGPVQPNPHEGGLADLDLKTMSMAEYAQRRADLGVHAPESMNHLFG